MSELRRHSPRLRAKQNADSEFDEEPQIEQHTQGQTQTQPSENTIATFGTPYSVIPCPKLGENAQWKWVLTPQIID